MVVAGCFLGLARLQSVSNGSRLLVVAGFRAGGTNGVQLWQGTVVTGGWEWGHVARLGSLG